MKSAMGTRSFMDSLAAAVESSKHIDHAMSIATHGGLVAQPGINARPSRITTA
jgi:hypothetical protein